MEIKYNYKKLEQFLENKGAGTCQICGAKNWSLSPSVFELREFNNGNLVIGGSLIPLIPITCSNCANTGFINAIISGAIESPKQGGNNEQ